MCYSCWHATDNPISAYLSFISDQSSFSIHKMADNDVDVNEELLDYEDDPETETPAAEAGAENGATKQEGKVKGNYVSIHSSGFRDFLLKPEVLRAIVDCGFEHPSEIQHECIPQVNFLFLLVSS